MTLSRQPWIIWFAISLHVLWGVLLLASPFPQFVTAINQGAKLAGGRYPLAILFLAVAALATHSLLRPNGWRGLLLLIPQQFVLVISAVGALHAMWIAQFADGVPRPQAFLIADQAPIVLAAILHTAAVISMHKRKRLA